MSAWETTVPAREPPKPWDCIFGENRSALRPQRARRRLNIARTRQSQSCVSRWNRAPNSWTGFYPNAVPEVRLGRQSYWGFAGGSEGASAVPLGFAIVESVSTL